MNLATRFLGTLAAVLATTALAVGAMNPAVFTVATPSIAVKPNTEFLIAVYSNPSTGYAWAITNKPDPKVISGEGSSYLAPMKLIGAGGQQIFAFEAHSAGTATITLQYRRPWEKHPTNVTVKTFSVTVK